MITERVKIGSTYYNLYTIVVFKGTQAEQIITVASENLNKRIEKEINKENYNEVSEIDGRYLYWVPKSEETDERSIVESIENAMISEMTNEEYARIKV